MKDIINTTLADIAKINIEVKEKLEQAAKMRKDALEPLLDALATSGEVSIIYIYGYTPGFNDGEPCEHSYDFFVNIEDLASNERLADVIDEEWIDELCDSYPRPATADDADAELCRANGHVFRRPSREIVSIIGSIIVDTIEEEKGTDYFVSFVLKDGKFERTDGDYDCGY